MKNAEITSLAVGVVGKSKRLQEMREKAMAARAVQAQIDTPKFSPNADKNGLSPELLLVREAIDRRLAEILTALPAGKQQRLFKIRYGIELEQVKHLPIARVIGILKIDRPDMRPSSIVMKRVADLNYLGQVVG